MLRISIKTSIFFPYVKTGTRLALLSLSSFGKDRWMMLFLLLER